MEWALVIIYFVGGFISATVLRARAGVGQRRIKIGGEGGYPRGWFERLVLTTMFWPISFVIWLARGRPEPRIVFDHKAEERRRRRAAGT